VWRGRFLVKQRRSGVACSSRAMNMAPGVMSTEGESSSVSISGDGERTAGFVNRALAFGEVAAGDGFLDEARDQATIGPHSGIAASHCDERD